MAEFYIRVDGVDRATQHLAAYGRSIHQAAAAGLQRGAVVVSKNAKTGVHSPQNPYIGVRGYDVSTGKLKSSVGVDRLQQIPGGQQIDISVHEVARVFARSVAGGGRNVNNRSPLVYGPVEERHHPFLGPALSNHIGEVLESFRAAFETTLRGLI